MASTWETCAFTFRAVSAKNQQSVGIYLIFQIFVLLAPLCKPPMSLPIFPIHHLTQTCR